MTHCESQKAQRRRSCWAGVAWLLGALAFEAPPAVAQSIEQALALMEAGEPALVDEGIRLLGVIESPEALPTLIQRIGRGLPPAQLETAIRTLATLQAPSAEAALISLTSYRREEIRVAACQALGSMGAHGAYQALVRRLSDREQIVREAAAQALGQLGDEAALPVLVESIEHGNEAAARALGRLVPGGNHSPLLGYLDQIPIYRLTPALAEVMVRRDVSTDFKLRLLARVEKNPDGAARGFLEGLYAVHAEALDPRVYGEVRRILAARMERSMEQVQ